MGSYLRIKQAILFLVVATFLLWIGLSMVIPHWSEIASVWVIFGIFLVASGMVLAVMGILKMVFSKTFE